VVINDLLTQQGENQRRKQIQFLPVIDDQNRIIQVVIVARDTTE
jgi:hypothetical protein